MDPQFSPSTVQRCLESRERDSRQTRACTRRPLVRPQLNHSTFGIAQSAPPSAQIRPCWGANQGSNPGPHARCLPRDPAVSGHALNGGRPPEWVAAIRRNRGAFRPEYPGNHFPSVLQQVQQASKPLRSPSGPSFRRCQRSEASTQHLCTRVDAKSGNWRRDTNLTPRHLRRGGRALLSLSGM